MNPPVAIVIMTILGAPSAENFNLLNKHVLQASLVCSSSGTAAAVEVLYGALTSIVAH